MKNPLRFLQKETHNERLSFTRELWIVRVNNGVKSFVPLGSFCLCHACRNELKKAIAAAEMK